ncbi:MAG: hypothetical protein VYA33_09585, partial [Pseudomonadota bacterium]|nr:hypothetical protein [Pseudomonadota bacterium]
NGNSLVVSRKPSITVSTAYKLLTTIAFTVFYAKNSAAAFLSDEISMMLDVATPTASIPAFSKAEALAFNFGSGRVNSNILSNFHPFILLRKPARIRQTIT